MQHCTPPGDCSVEHRYYMLYAVRNIVPLLVIAHPVQPGDGGTSWRLEEYITPCQHILSPPFFFFCKSYKVQVQS